MSNLSIWTFDSFLNSLLSCCVLILYAKPIPENTAGLLLGWLKINGAVNVGALCYFLTAHFVIYSISGKNTFLYL